MKYLRAIGLVCAVAVGGCDEEGSTEDGAAPSDDGDAGNLLVGDDGAIRLQLERSPNATVDPFAGTVQVSVTGTYLECLVEFYHAYPDQQQRGTQGAVEFTEAMADLCQSEPGGIECSVAEISQEMDVARQLTVVYDVRPPLEGGTLRFGPLPSADVVTCSTGAPVRLSGPAAVHGLDAEGRTVWDMDSFALDQAATEPGAPTTIFAIGTAG